MANTDDQKKRKKIWVIIIALSPIDKGGRVRVRDIACAFVYLQL